LFEFYWFVGYVMCYFSRIVTDYVVVLWCLIWFEVNFISSQDRNR